MATNPDFKDLFSALSDAGVEFLVVGAHAVMVYTEPRYTKDLDIWIRPTNDNAIRAYRALAAFGAPMGDLTPEDLETPGTIFQIGVAPNRIDVLTSVEALQFEDAWRRRVPTSYGGVAIHVLSAEDLVVNKRAVARPQDLLDVEKLERILRRRPPR
jgi:hypothetical protein